MSASHLNPELLQDLVRRYLCEDDESAIERLVQLTRAPLLAAAGRVGRPTDAEDAVQVAYLSLTRRRGRDLDAPVFPWLLVATLRVAYRKKATQQRQDDIAAALTEGGSLAVESPEPGGAELAALVGAKIAALPQRYRDVLYLHYIAGLSHSDLARLLAAPIDTIRTRLHRGRALLRGRLSPRLYAALCFAPWWLIDHAPALGSASGGAFMAKKTVSVTLLVLAIVGAGGWAARNALNTDHDEAAEIVQPTALDSNDGPLPEERPPSPPVLASRTPPGPPPAASTAPASAPFFGEVVDPVGRPVVGARIETIAARRDAGGGHVYVFSRRRSDARNAATDPSGRFSIRDPNLRDSCSLDLLVTATGFPITRAEARRGKRARIVLEAGGDLRVRVVDSQGETVPGANVGVLAAKDIGLVQGHREFHPFITAETDRSGRIAWLLAAGTYRLHVRADDYPYFLSEPLKLEAADVLEHVLRLPEGAPVRLRVVDEQGAPVVGAAAQMGAPRNKARSLTTNSEGVVEVKGLPLTPPGGVKGGQTYWDHRVYWFVTAPGFAPAEGSQALPADAGGLTINVHMKRGYLVRVRVVDDAGAKMESAAVTVQLDGSGANPLAKERRLRFVTDAEGYADLGRLTARHSRITVSATRAHEYVRTKLELTKDGEHEVVLARRSGSVQGRVLGPDGQPVAGVRVGWAPAAWTYAKAAGRRAGVFAKADGAFQLLNVRGGEGHLVLRAPGYAPQRHTLDLPEGSSRDDVVVRLRSDGRIAGRVQKRDGAGVGSITVSLWQQYTVGKAIQGAQVATVTADADGRFAFLGVPSDVGYRLHVVSSEWRSVGLGDEVRRGQEELVVTLKPRSEAIGLPLRLRVTSRGSRYAGPLQVTWGSGSALKMASEQADSDEGVRRFGVGDSPGTFTFQLTAPGHRPKLLSRVRMLDTRNPPVLDATLDRGAEIELEVLDEAGKPVVDATLKLVSRWADSWTSETIKTDARGVCRLGGLVAGRETRVVARLQSDRWTEGVVAGAIPPATARIRLRRYGFVRVRCPWTYGDLVGSPAFRLLRSDGTVAATWEPPSGDWPDATTVLAWLRVHEVGTFRVEIEHAGRMWTAEIKAGPGRLAEVQLR